MKISVLASGSKGNATLVTDGETNILVDAGITKSKIEKHLAIFGLSLDDISAILITHAHIDHFKGLEAILKKKSIPVFASEETATSIELCLCECIKKGTLNIDWNYFSPGSQFTFNHLLITPFEVPHDANGAVAYIIEENGEKIGIATDLGCITNSVRYHLQGCDALVLEMNHDMRMLKDSDRPEMLKIRIASKLGHLSNDQAAEFLDTIDASGLKYLFPAHMSEDCNDLSCVKAAILSLEKKFDFLIVKTGQEGPTPLIDLSVNNL